MAKLWKRMLLPLLLVLLMMPLSSCGKESVADRDILTTAKTTNTIVWGVKADTRLFGLMDIKTGKIEGFDVDMAKAITKQILGSKGKAQLVQVTSDTRVPMIKGGNVDAVIATMTITPERQKILDFSDVYFNAGQSILVKKAARLSPSKT